MYPETQEIFEKKWNDDNEIREQYILLFII